MSTGRKHLHHLVPLVDIYQTSGGIIVCIDLPGVEKGQIKLNIEGDRLLLTCEKANKRPRLTRGFFQLLEREYGFFRRELLLPSGLWPEKAEAKMDNGVLVIQIPWKSAPG
jgi:HSP20 family protein